jgi:hypothetical protein
MIYAASIRRASRTTGRAPMKASPEGERAAKPRASGGVA